MTVSQTATYCNWTVKWMEGERSRRGAGGGVGERGTVRGVCPANVQTDVGQ